MLGMDMDTKDKLTVLSFDEMYLSHQIDFDKSKEQVIGPHKTVQVVMARGLVSSWKQPVFYNYDTPMTPEILNDIICNLHDIDFNVISIVNDMGPTNQRLWKNMNVSHNTPNFNHPITGNRIHVFADVPHLLKLCRNNFIDNGFILQHSTNKIFIGLNTVNQLVGISKQDLKLPYKLSNTHLNCTGAMRQKVKLAAQLFSKSVATAILFAGKREAITTSNWQHVS